VGNRGDSRVLVWGVPLLGNTHDWRAMMEQEPYCTLVFETKEAYEYVMAALEFYRKYGEDDLK
jgi:hypothetical protein